MPALKSITASALFLASGAALLAEGGHERAASLSDTLHLPITNSILTSWVVTFAIIIGIRWLVGTPKTIPGRGQSIVETALEALKDLYGPIVGKKVMPVAFPLLVTLFIFIVLHNWSGLLPFVGTMGWGHTDASGHFHVVLPLIRPHTSELNGTIALALVSFGAWIILVMKYAGPGVLIKDLFGNKADKKELSPGVYWAISLVFLVVGVIEVISILIRPITLSMRLFGNVFGGETLLHSMSFLPPFYFLELLVGFVQGLVFTLLSAVYIGLICNHGDDHGDEHGHGDDHAHAPAGAKEAAH
ncbi:MAG: F0F1 ATP synthase subunit A [Opitutaceae bacterium]